MRQMLLLLLPPLPLLLCHASLLFYLRRDAASDAFFAMPRLRCPATRRRAHDFRCDADAFAAAPLRLLLFFIERRCRLPPLPYAA